MERLVIDIGPRASVFASNQLPNGRKYYIRLQRQIAHTVGYVDILLYECIHRVVEVQVCVGYVCTLHRWMGHD